MDHEQRQDVHADAVSTRTPGAGRSPTARQLGAVFLGGMLGGGARIGVALAFPHDAGIPWATLLVNVLGALVLGFVGTRLAASAPPSSLAVPLLCTGFLGSFTTFSTFSQETWELASGADPVTATGYVIGSLVLGVLAARAGMVAAQR